LTFPIFISYNYNGTRVASVLRPVRKTFILLKLLSFSRLQLAPLFGKIREEFFRENVTKAF
jgi:hypothetical protein